MEANNAAAIREALKRLLNLAYEVQDANSECEYGPKTSVPAQFVIDVANSALAAPPRNCDVGTAAEQSQRFCAFCRPRLEPCDGCPCLEGAQHGRCEFIWAQMPYKEGGEK